MTIFWTAAVWLLVALATGWVFTSDFRPRRDSAGVSWRRGDDRTYAVVGDQEEEYD